MMIRVCIALSGGVDSAVSAALLKEAGYDVFAVFAKVWQPDFLPCTQEEDRKSAKRVAAALDIPFYVLDCTDVYKREIVDEMVAAYAAGETPNPDVLCNVHVKFGALWEYARKLGAEFLATGHYAQTIKLGESTYLAKARDAAKDQVYFISQMPQSVIPHVLFPVGSLLKEETRAKAVQLQLPVATKKDSQGLCFMGMVEIAEFLGHMVSLTPGAVLDAAGIVIGSHTGAQQFTLGQRHGFTIHAKNAVPLYVSAVSTEKNTITVSSTPPLGATTLILQQCIVRSHLSETTVYTAQVRYHGEEILCTVSCAKDSLTLTLSKPVLVAARQICVVYDGGIVVASGVVARP